ncbi:MAG: hypothetical protein AAF604_12060 [Acidobacteriota bacterium]
MKPASLLLASLFLTAPVHAQMGPAPHAVFPSAKVDDGRFLGFTCEPSDSGKRSTSLFITVRGSQPDFTLSLFDGETGGSDGGGLAHWDAGDRALRFSLFADPLAEGSTNPANLIAQWNGNAPNPLAGSHWRGSATTMPDNDWWSATILNSPLAETAGGPFQYHLVIALEGSCAGGEALESNVKVAVSRGAAFRLRDFALVAALRDTFNDSAILYPGLDILSSDPRRFVDAPTTYDGTLSFFVEVPPRSTSLKIFDGDIDRGTSNDALIGLPSNVTLPACSDSDDLDTPGDYSGFPFLPTGDGETAIGAGSPRDDSRLDLFRRGEPGDPDRRGCVRYELIDPLGNVYRNDNPSGNGEWEQFRIISTLDPDAGNAQRADIIAPMDTLPAGTWRVRLVGLDLSNLTFWHASACSAQQDPGSGALSAACPKSQR